MPDGSDSERTPAAKGMLCLLLGTRATLRREEHKTRVAGVGQSDEHARSQCVSPCARQECVSDEGAAELRGGRPTDGEGPGP
eukprot:2536198-Alexandrium_andersonii.AAC.1